MGKLTVCLFAIFLFIGRPIFAAMTPFAFWRKQPCELNAAWTPQYSNIIGYWNLNGTAGASIPNNTTIAATLGADGTAKNSGKTYVAGKMGPNGGTGVAFGSSSYITMGNPTSLNGSQLSSGTMAAWVNIAAFTGSKTVMGKEFSYKMEFTDKTGDFSYPSGGVTLSLYVSTNGTTWQCTVETQSTVPVGSWAHVAATWDQTNPIKLYINGTAQTPWSDCNLSSGGVPFNTGNDFQLSGWGGGNETYSGSLDEAAVWNVALTAAQISKLYSVQNSCSY